MTVREATARAKQTCRSRASRSTASVSSVASVASVARVRVVAAAVGVEGGEVPMSPQYEAALRVRRAVLSAQREELLHWRDVGRLPDEGLRRLERELDHEEGRLPVRP